MRKSGKVAVTFALRMRGNGKTLRERGLKEEGKGKKEKVGELLSLGKWGWRFRGRGPMARNLEKK